MLLIFGLITREDINNNNKVIQEFLKLRSEYQSHNKWFSNFSEFVGYKYRCHIRELNNNNEKGKN